MNVKKITLSLVCGVVAAAAFGQAQPATRVFIYDGTVGTNGIATYVVNGDGANAYVFAGAVPGNTNNNAVINAASNFAGFAVDTVINVSSYVFISGNFGGTYTVQGVGAGYDQNQELSQVEIATNRSLTFTAYGFYGLGPEVGYIYYTMSLLQDYPSNGVVLSGTGSALADSNFNGATVQLNATTQLPLDGRATLQIGRELQLTQGALGGHTYSASGTIQVGVN